MMNLLLLGDGAAARDYARAALTSGGHYRFAAVCSGIGEEPTLRTHEFAAVLGIPAVCSFTDALSLPRIVGVVDTSAPWIRSDSVRTALIGGKHVLAESPLALDVDEFEGHCRIAAERGLVLLTSRLARSQEDATVFLSRIGGETALDIVIEYPTDEGMLPATRGPHRDERCLWGCAHLMQGIEIGTLYFGKPGTPVEGNPFNDRDGVLTARVRVGYPGGLTATVTVMNVQGRGRLMVNGHRHMLDDAFGNVRRNGIGRLIAAIHAGDVTNDHRESMAAMRIHHELIGP